MAEELEFKEEKIRLKAIRVRDDWKLEPCLLFRFAIDNRNDCEILLKRFTYSLGVTVGSWNTDVGEYDVWKEEKLGADRETEFEVCYDIGYPKLDILKNHTGSPHFRDMFWRARATGYFISKSKPELEPVKIYFGDVEFRITAVDWENWVKRWEQYRSEKR